MTTLKALLESSSLRVLAPGEQFCELLFEMLLQSKITGNLVFDAQLVALCREHGVRTVCSNDRDLDRFSGIEVRPLAR